MQPDHPQHDRFSAGFLGADGAFLGLVSGDPTSPDSVCNRNGPYGSPTGQFSIYNRSGVYGGIGTAGPDILSAQDTAATNPPEITDGTTISGYVTRNPSIANGTPAAQLPCPTAATAVPTTTATVTPTIALLPSPTPVATEPAGTPMLLSTVEANVYEDSISDYILFTTSSCAETVQSSAGVFNPSTNWLTFADGHECHVVRFGTDHGPVGGTP